MNGAVSGATRCSKTAIPSRPGPRGAAAAAAPLAEGRAVEAPEAAVNFV